ncbi:MAG: beta strand repeat-containing protein, partial [Acidimicrobiales bacterium]
MTLAPGGTVTVTIPSNLVPSSATAVALSVTAVDATQAGFLAVYPGGSVTGSPTSVLNFVAGPPNCTIPDCVVPNLVITPVNSGEVTVLNTNANGGTVDVVVDLEGYFDPTNATASGAGHYYAQNPVRVIDTRCASTPPKPGITAAQCAAEATTIVPQNAAKGTVASNSVLNVATGLTGASAAVVQLTATNESANGYLTAYSGTATSRPNASNVNFVQGQTTSTRAIVPVGSDGSINIYNYNGSTDVAVDVVGYYSDSSGSTTGGALFTPIAPARIIDTRATNSPLPANTSRSVQIAGAVGIPAESNGQPTSAALNVTEATSDLGGFLTVTPNTITPPATTSDVNFQPGQIRANADVATLNATGGISVYNYFGNTNFIIDAFGYFSAASSFPAIILSPTSGVAGTSVTATLSGVTNPSGVTVSGCGLGTTALTPAANGSYTFTIPTAQGAGLCVLTFSGTGTSGTFSTQGDFTVTSTPAPGTIAASVSPTSGNAGSTVTATLTGPNGAALSGVTVSGCGLTNQSITAGANGTYTFTVPTGTAAGACTLTFSGTANGATATGTASFTVTTTTPATINTNAPTLTSASIVTNGFPTASQSVVQYVFDQPVTVGTVNDFSLVGYPTSRDTSGTSAAVDA